MLRQKNSLKTILQLDEKSFRLGGSHGDKLISILKQGEQRIKDNVLSIRTNLTFSHGSLEIQAFNLKLRELRQQNIVLIQVRLDS